LHCTNGIKENKVAKDWAKLKDLTREISMLALNLKIMVRSYVIGTTNDGIDVDKTLLLPKATQTYQDLQAKMDELKTEWLK
jgi:hypothetical protein